MHSIKDIVKQLIGKSLDAYNTKYTKVLNTRIDNIVAQAGNDNTEIVDARIDSAGVTHTTLNNRILAETKMNDEQLIEYTGSSLSAEDTTQGYLKDVEILGNTIQNEEDLADIKSVGKLQEDGTYKMSISSCGKNLISNFTFSKGVSNGVGGINTTSTAGILTHKGINVKKNVNYVLKTLDFSKFSNIYVIAKDLKTVISVSSNGTLSFNSGDNSIIYIQANTKVALTDDGSLLMNDNIQLEEGTVATPYEPYQGNKCDILLPCQLEKVGDVSDRLYYDDVEKAWCIEKNIVDEILDETKSWHYAQNLDKDNTALFTLGGFSQTVSNQDESCFTDLFINKVIYSKDEEGCYISNSGNLYLRVSKEKAYDFNTFKSYITTNNIKIKYAKSNSAFISLPRDTQIALNSFFGTTHVYMESGEVEGTIKCKIPKSLGATVQSLNNKTDILSDRIEAIEGLKDSQNMKYETDKGYLVCKETKNGVIDDLKIEGKTLVSLHYKKTHTNNMVNLYNWFYATNGFKVEIGKTYTVIANINNLVDVKYKSSNNMVFSGLGNANKIKTFIAKENDELVFVNLVTGQYSMSDLMILEGDHTQNPPSYFEGLMSVGEDVDKIEVLSRKEDGNLISFENLKNININSGTGIESEDSTKIATDYIKLENGTYTCFNVSNFAYNIFIYDNNKKYIRNAHYTTSSFTLTGSETFVRWCGRKNDSTAFNFSEFVNSGIVLAKGKLLPEDSDIKSDKKQILFYNENGELEPVTELHEWDSIEKHSNNKLYYHKRSEEVVLNGSENWIVSTNHSTDTFIWFYLQEPTLLASSEVICDKFNYSKFKNNRDSEYIYIDKDFNILIARSKLSSQGVTGFKQWLQANNVTVVYQLAQEEVYELAPLHLDSYANETLILCNSGAIRPKMEFSITSHINELVKTYGERVNILEEKVYQYMIAQNRMQLASTYSADSVTFKVDYFSLCGDEENYNEDLYNLILNNILVGKDNYDYDKMFTITLDYASWNQISWEQFDILVGLMDIQRNPPVEEEITEDESTEETPVE